jgi:hypothetical protein
MSAQVVSVTVSTEVNNTNPNVEDFWDKVKSFLMSAAEDELGLEPGSGTVQTNTVVSLVLGETKSTITATFRFNGIWEPD